MNSCLNLKRVLTSKSGPISKQFNVMEGKYLIVLMLFFYIAFKTKIPWKSLLQWDRPVQKQGEWAAAGKIVLSWHVSTQLSWASRCVLAVFSFHCTQVIKQDFPLRLPSPFCIYSVRQHKWHTVTPTDLFWGWIIQTAFIFWLVLKRILGEKEKVNSGSADRMDGRAALASRSLLSCQVLILGALRIGDGLTQCLPALQPLLILICHQIRSHPVSGKETV